MRYEMEFSARTLADNSQVVNAGPGQAGLWIDGEEHRPLVRAESQSTDKLHGHAQKNADELCIAGIDPLRYLRFAKVTLDSALPEVRDIVSAPELGKPPGQRGLIANSEGRRK